MKTSLVITTFNEQESIQRLLASIKKQTKLPDEVVIVDSKSTDKTVKIINKFTKILNINVISKECNRGEGRNIGVENARNEIIAMTDAGCTADKHWLKRLTSPFRNNKSQVIAGYYTIPVDTPRKKAAGVFLGVTEHEYTENFLPSARSLAFKKTVWKKIGGFPSINIAEDTMFNHKLLNHNIKITRVKNAVVEWATPDSLSEILGKFYSYAKGDAQTNIWRYDNNYTTSHNVKVLLIYFRYTLGILLLFLSFYNPLFITLLILGLVLYSIWAFNKVYRQFNSVEAGFWGIFFQFGSDMFIMSGFLAGTIRK
jgi:glycosyltransferase involved in cell wall biosynthesis